MSPVLANIFGPEALIVLAVVALLFGGSQLPKLARSVGSAKSEFEKAQREGQEAKERNTTSSTTPVTDPDAPTVRNSTNDDNR